MLKDQANKKAHEGSAHLACEAAGSIRTVASLTREDDCCDLYSQSLEIPLQQSNRTAIWSGLLFSFSQAMVFFVIALVFWYGSLLVSKREYAIFQFFVGLMVGITLFFFCFPFEYVTSLSPPNRARHSVLFKLGTFFPSYPTCPPPRVQLPTSSN